MVSAENGSSGGPHTASLQGHDFVPHIARISRLVENKVEVQSQDVLFLNPIFQTNSKDRVMRDNFAGLTGWMDLCCEEGNEGRGWR